MPAASSAIMAHEMGHNFGFIHDNELEQNPNVTCNCDDPSRYCIMDFAIRCVSACCTVNPVTVHAIHCLLYTVSQKTAQI